MTHAEREKAEQAALLLCIAAAEGSGFLRRTGDANGFPPAVITLAWDRWWAEDANDGSDCDERRLRAAERLFAEVYS